MKKLLFVTLILLITVNLSAQHFDNEIESDDVQFNMADPETFSRNSNETVWVTDSIYYYNAFYSEDWILWYRKKTLERNSKGKLLNGIGHFFGTESHAWEKKDTTVCKYYESGIIKEYLKRPWDYSTNRWADTGFFKKYNEAGVLTSIFSKYWSYDASMFHGGFKKVYTLNENDSVAWYLYYAFEDDDGWVLKHRVVYYYDGDLLRQEIKEIINDDGDWQNAARYIYSYDNDGIKTVELYQEWADNDWESVGRSLFYYENGNLSKEVMQGLESSWVDNLRWFYSYDENNNLIEKRSELRKDELWVDDLKYTYAYDDNQNLIETGFYKKDMSNTEWKKNKKVVYYWSQITLNVDYNKQNRVTLFPNPAGDYFYIKGSNRPEAGKVLIYDMKGRLVRKYNRLNRRFDVAGLMPGKYIVAIYDRDTKTGNKILVVK